MCERKVDLDMLLSYCASTRGDSQCLEGYRCRVFSYLSWSICSPWCVGSVSDGVNERGESPGRDEIFQCVNYYGYNGIGFGVSRTRVLLG